MKNSNSIIERVLTTQSKNIAILAYFTFIGLLISMAINSERRSPFSSYHVQQSLGLLLLGFILGVVAMIPVLGWVISIFGSFLLLYMWISGLIYAANGKAKPVPLLGEKFEEWFQNLPI